MKHGLRIGAASSQLIQNNRREIEKEKTLMEKQKNFKYRDYPSDEYTLLQNAQRKGWNGYHTGSLQNSKKTFAFYSEGLFHFCRLPFQKKCFYTLGIYFCTAPNDTKTPFHTRDKKITIAFLLVVANGYFHDSEKQRPPLN